MFGFPFFTSLIIVLAGVIALSLIINKGQAKRRLETADSAIPPAAKNTSTSH